MALESVTYIADLVPTNPDGADSRTTADDHLRNGKKASKNSFSGYVGGIQVTGTDGGAVNVYTIANSLPSYTDRLSVIFSPSVTNTGAATLNVNSLGAKAIKRIDGAALTAGELVAGSIYEVIYNGTEFRLQSATLGYINDLSLGTAFPTSAADTGKFLKSTGTGFAWDVAGIGTVASASGATNVVLTASSAGYQSVTFTAMGKHVSLPDATGLTVGGPRYIIKNDGGYPFGIRDNAGTLIMAVAAGGIAYVTLKDNATAAGSWSVIGDNLEPGLITIDNTFSSTYSSTVLAPFVALDSNTSIHFAALSSGFAAFVVDNTGKTVGTPVTVSATSAATPVHAFKVSATSAICFYKTGTNAFAVVLSVSGTTISVGTALTSGNTTDWSGENFTGAPKIAQLSPTLYVYSYTPSGTSIAAISVSGTTVTEGAAASVGSSVVSNSTTTYALTATTALVLYLVSGAANSVNAAVITVTGTTCAVGSPVSTGNATNQTVPPASCLLSPTKVLFSVDSGSDIKTFVATITGTGVAFSAGTNMGDTGTFSFNYTANGATRYNPHLLTLSTTTALLWYINSAGHSRVAVLTESGGNVTAGTIVYRSISSGTDAIAGAGRILPQGSSDFLALIQSAPSSVNAYSFRLNPHKISGTTITTGVGIAVPELPIDNNVTSYVTARLSSGDYLIAGCNTAGAALGNAEVPVYRSNGDAIVKRGSIRVPNLNSISFPAGPVASNRLVLMGAAVTHTSSTSAITNLRLLNVEIAA